MIKFLSLLVLILFSPLCGEPLPDSPLQMAELIDIALQNNPETQSAWWRTKEAASERKSANSPYYPQMNVNGGVNHGREYKFINGPETPFTTVNTDLTFTYLLWDCGERKANVCLAEAALNAVQWQQDWTFQKVIFDVVARTYDFLQERERLLALNESLKDASQTLEATEDLQKAGLKAKTDCCTSKAASAEVRIELARQKAAIQIAQAKLAASVGMDVGTVLTLVDLPEPEIGLRQDPDSLIATALEKRADLLSKRARKVETNARYASTKSRYAPKVQFFGDVGWRRYVRDREDGFQYNTALTFDIPLFTGFEAYYKKQAAYASSQALQADIEQMELAIALDVYSAVKQFEAAQESLELTREYLKYSTQSYEGVLDKYKVGTQNIFELITAQRQLSHARLKQADSKIRWFQTLAQLAYVTGTITQLSEDSCTVSD
jgi:outer membrane protein